MLNFRLSRPAALIDLNRIGPLAYVREDNGTIALGAMTRQRTIEFSPLVAQRLPLLAEATRWVGHLPIRSRGTIGGSIAHADPSAEYPAVLTVLDGAVVAQSPRGRRTLSAGELFETYLTTRLAADELLVEVRLPAMPAGCRLRVRGVRAAPRRLRHRRHRGDGRARRGAVRDRAPGDGRGGPGAGASA